MAKTGPEERRDPLDALREEAWVWLRVLNAGEVSAWEAEGFRRWLRTSAAHKVAYREARERWQALRPLAGGLLQSDPALATRHRQYMTFSRGRRAFLGALAGASALTVAAVAVRPPAGLWPAMDEWTADERTAKGEQRVLDVSGGVLTLNTRTSLRRQAGSEIELIAGEAAIDLIDRSLFTVAAGAARSRATLAKFQVRYIDGQACVSCLEGQVHVEHSAGQRALRAGEQVHYDALKMGGVVAVKADAVAAWRRGELVFDGVALSEVIAEINRYRPGRVILMKDTVRDEAVTGSFRIAALDQALQQLQHTFGLKGRALGGELLVLS